ncbi:MAG: rhodanese-like domain-containing protein [Flavobacterium sp.]|nr:MAG: rhodanese-like domain-containing protein [Flavobacterium sp.]
MQDLTQEQWQKQLAGDDNAVIIDVRTPHEIAEGYIPDALFMNIQDAGSFMQKAQELDKTKNYFIYCRVGGRSKQACLILDSIGFENTYNLMGGFEDWQGAKTQ